MVKILIIMAISFLIFGSSNFKKDENLNKSYSEKLISNDDTIMYNIKKFVESNFKQIYMESYFNINTIVDVKGMYYSFDVVEVSKILEIIVSEYNPDRWIFKKEELNQVNYYKAYGICGNIKILLIFEFEDNKLTVLHIHKEKNKTR